MRCGHANCLQDRGERIRPPRQLGEAMLHEAVPDDQTQWDRSPSGNRRSADQIDGKITPRCRPPLYVVCHTVIHDWLLSLKGDPKEVANGGRNLSAMRFQRKVAGV